MKRTGVLLVLLLVLAAGVSAHDKGDLTLNVEAQIGGAFPYLPLMFRNQMMPGIDFALRGIVDYHFAEFFSVNAGLGYGLNYHIFANFYEQENDQHGVIGGGSQSIALWILLFPVMIVLNYGYNLLVTAANTRMEATNDFFASYITIPFGFKFHLQAFTAGGGLTGNIPVYGSGSLEKRNAISGADEDSRKLVYTFKLLPYMGWFVDLGFDLSARKTKPRKFGMAFRLAGPLVDEVVLPSALSFKADIDPYKFYFVSASLVFKVGGFRLASLPIGGKKQEEPAAAESASAEKTKPKEPEPKEEAKPKEPEPRESRDRLSPIRDI